MGMTFRPGSGGGGPTTPVFTALNISNLLGTLDPFSIQDGAITMSGDNFVIPVSVATQANALSTGLVLQFALPSGICDGSEGILLTHVTFASRPSFGAYGVVTGVYDAVTTAGQAAGARNATGTAMMKPIVTRGGGQIDGPDLSATALIAEGVIHLPGSWDGVDLLTGSMCANMEESGAARGVGSNTTIGTALVTANQRLIVGVMHGGFSLEAGTITVKCESAVLPNPF